MNDERSESAIDRQGEAVSVREVSTGFGMPAPPRRRPHFMASQNR